MPSVIAISVDVLTKCFLQIDGWISKDFLLSIPTIISALLLPIALFLVEIPYGRDGKNEIDLNIIIDKVLVAKKFLIFFIVGLFSLAVIDKCKLLAIIYDLLLVIFTFYILNNTKKWLSVKEIFNEDDFNYKQKLRYQYYISQTNADEIYHTWKIIFANINKTNQSHVISAFIEVVERLDGESGLYGNNQDRMVKLLIANIDKVSFNDYAEYERLIDFALSYYYDVYCKDNNEKDKHPAESKRELLNLVLEKAIINRRENHSFYEHIAFDRINYLSFDRIDIRLFLYNIFSSIKNAYDKSDEHLYDIWGHDFFRKIRIKANERNKYDGFIIESYLNELSRVIRNNKINEKSVVFVENLTEALLKR